MIFTVFNSWLAQYKAFLLYLISGILAPADSHCPTILSRPQANAICRKARVGIYAYNHHLRLLSPAWRSSSNQYEGA